MFSYEEGRAFDDLYTKGPSEEQKIVARSAISGNPIYEGDEVIFDGNCSMIFPNELKAFLDNEVETIGDGDLMDLLDEFMGNGMPRSTLEKRAKKYIEIYTNQNRNQELMDIFGLTKGVADND